MGQRRKTTKPQVDESVGVADVALIASILGNLKQFGERTELLNTVEALQQVIGDWQFAYTNLDAQLTLALRANQEQTALLNSLRAEMIRLRNRVAHAEKRALDSEAELRKLKESKDSTLGRVAPH